MALTANFGVHEINKKLYAALTRGEKDEVKKWCRSLEDGPLHMVTVHNDTILHMAAYSKQKDLFLDLLEKVPPSDYTKLMLQNDMGDTILHEAATSNILVPAAKQILLKAPALLRMPNEKGETAIFRAARYGERKMFEFLDEAFTKDYQSENKLKAFHRRSDGATILHMSVAAEHFELAFLIAMRYEYLTREQDGDGMTALQHLACKPSAFYSASKRGHIKKFIYSCLSTATPMEEGGQPWCRVPLVESIRNDKRKYESAWRLAKFLIERDTSWESSASRLNLVDPRTHKYRKPTDQSSQKRKEEEEKEGQINNAAETPLILATKSGCLEIVEEILKMYPQAIEHVDDEGRNILHVAIKYRQIHIFDFVEKMEFPMRRLVRKIDNNGNSILHTVGIKGANQTDDDLRNPAIRLQENLLLFERVERTCSTFYGDVLNNDQKTAEKLFAESNVELHSEAKDWLKRTAENCSIVAVLIATVAFAAAYTVPGGSNESTGYPVLLNQPFFIIFTISDVLSITFALTSVVTFLSILTSPFQLINFKRSLPLALMLGVTLLILSVSMMMLAFAATIILTLRDKREWTKIVLYSMAFFPVSIFAASYLPLYVSLWKNLEEYRSIVRDAFPRCTCDPKRYEEATVNPSFSLALEERGAYSV